MSSTNKTTNYQLNSWVGSDIPQREDFNSDNEIIDNVLSTHLSDSNIHTTAKEKKVWNSPCTTITYYGDGSSSRVIALQTDYNPSWGLIFAIGKPLQICDFDNKASYSYGGFFSNRGCSMGISLSAKNLGLTQSSSAMYDYEYRSLNEKGVTYIVVAFR